MQNWDKMEDGYTRNYVHSYGHRGDSFERPYNCSKMPNWDQMEDGYARKYGYSYGHRGGGDSFERPHNDDFTEQQINPLCLLIRNIPINLDKERFRILMSADGRRVTKIHFNEKTKPNFKTTFAFVHFAAEEDALHAFEIFSSEDPNMNPLEFKPLFANKRKDENMVDNNLKSMQPLTKYAPSVGRGRRIDLNSRSTPSVPVHNLKVETHDSSRRITLESAKNSEKQEGLIPNPFLSCFRCGNESHFACKKCKLPYCSAVCRNSDVGVHENICRRAKGMTESLLLFYEDSPGYANSHSATESTSGGSDKENLESNSNQLVKKNEDNNKKIQKLNLAAGTNEMVKVVKAESLDEFWVHIKKFSEELRSMEEKFSHANLSPLKSCKENTICCASYHGSKICRAEILEENPSDVLAYLLDHGINVTVEKKCLYCLPADCWELPAQALCCKLVNRQDIGKIQWNEKDVESFKLILDSETVFRAHVVRCYDDVHEVSLTNRDGIALSTILMSINTIDAEKPTQISVPRSPVDTSQKKATMFLPDVLAKKPQLNKHADYVAKPLMVLPTKNLSKLNEYIVTVPVIKSASDLCVQIANETENLMKMCNELNAYCSREKSEHAPSIGEFVCSKFPEDGMWYRCKVLKKIQDRFEVEYVDYGNEAIVPQSDIQVLPDKFISPMFGIRVSLSGIKNEDLKREHMENICRDTWNMKIVDDKKSPIEIMLFKKGISLSVLISNKNKDAVMPHVSSLQKRSLSDEISKVTLSLQDSDITYCHLHCDNKQIINLYNILQKCGREGATPTSLSIGDVICAKGSDGSWCRASVISDEKGPSYEVLLLDYGGTAIINADSIRFLSAEALEFPIFTISLKIANREKVDYSGPFSVRKIKTLQDDKYLVEAQIEGDGLIPKISSFQMETLPENSAVMVNVIVIDADKFYVQQVSHKNKIAELENELQLKAATFADLPGKPNVEDVICAKYSDDGRWYRCVVLKVCEGQIEGFFIDYGNTETISMENLKSLPSELCMYPKLCLPVKFNNVKAVYSKLEKGIITFKVKFLKLDDDGTTQVVEDVSEGSVDIPKISSLQTKSLVTNSIAKVTIVFSDNEIFYVQCVADFDKIEHLKQQLLHANKFVDLPCIPVVDEVICAKYSLDNEWYRCVVLGTEVSSDKIVVSFIDYGNTETIAIENLKCLPSELCSYPVFCVPMKFNNAEAVKSINEATFDVIVLNIEGNVHIVDIFKESAAKPVLSTYTPTMFSSLEKSDLPLDKACKVIFKANIDNFYFVLKSGDASELEKLNSVLQNTKTDAVVHSPSLQEILLVKGKNNLLYRCCVEKADPDKGTYKVYLVDEGITEEVKKNELYNLPENCKRFPVFIVKILAGTKEAIILNKCYNIKAIKQNSDGVYDAEIFIPYMCSSLKRQQLPTNVESVVIFFHKEQNKIFLQDLKDIKMITELQTALLEISPTSRMPYKPAVGEILCARSQLDNSWYRASIEEQLKADEYRVTFIDFGNSENLTLEHLTIIPASLVSFPSLAIPVKFADEKILMSVELEKKYTVIAESNDSVQTVRLVMQQTNVPKFKLSSCKEIEWHSGTQDVIIYSVELDGSVCCAPYDIDKITENIQLISHLNNHVQKNGIPFDDCEPEPEEMVLAQYAEEWYRGTIITKSDSGFVVNFVDFGNTEDLNLSCLRKMDEQFMEHEIQTALCTLTGFTYERENLPQIVEELKKFGYFESQKHLSAEIHVDNGDVTANIPSITTHLLEKRLVAVP